MQSFGWSASLEWVDASPVETSHFPPSDGLGLLVLSAVQVANQYAQR